MSLRHQIWGNLLGIFAGCIKLLHSFCVELAFIEHLHDSAAVSDTAPHCTSLTLVVYLNLCINSLGVLPPTAISLLFLVLLVTMQA